MLKVESETLRKWFEGGLEIHPFNREDALRLHDNALRLIWKLSDLNPGHIPASADPRFHHDFARDLMKTAYLVHRVKDIGATEFSRGLLPHLRRRIKEAIFTFWEEDQLESGQLPHEVKSPYVDDDSVDATPLGLIIILNFIENKEEFEKFYPRIIRALDWMTRNMDTSGYNGWLCYKYNDHNGGHINQGWMDARDAITYGTRRSRDERPIDPIALVEVQGYAWEALRRWADRLRDGKLLYRANDLKRRFNKHFVMKDKKGIYLAYALDGNGEQLQSVSVNPGLALWASYEGESIIEEQHIPHIVGRLMSEGMFDSEAGIRTFENGQETYKEHEGYQTGDDTFWSIATCLSADGMMKTGFKKEAVQAMRGDFTAINTFGSFVEHFKKEGKRVFWNGSDNCFNQTWTAASVLLESAVIISEKAY